MVDVGNTFYNFIFIHLLLDYGYLCELCQIISITFPIYFHLES